MHEPVIAALVLAGFFDLVSGAPLSRGGLLFVVAVALIADAVRGRRRSAFPPSRGVTESGGTVSVPRPSIGSVLALLAYATVAGAFARYSWPATLAVTVPAVSVVAYAWYWSAGMPAAPGGEPLDRRGATLWLGLFVVLALWELIALLGQPTLEITSYEHPTISYLMDGVLASRVGRSVTIALWAASGWYLLGRDRS